MAATSLAITLSRAAAVKYLPPVGSEAYSISILNPDAEESSWITYLIQFSEELWLAVLTMAFLIAIILCLAEEWRKKSHDIKVGIFQDKIGLKLLKSLFSSLNPFKNSLAPSGLVSLPILAGNLLSHRREATGLVEF